MLKPNGDAVLIDFGMAREYKADRNHDTFYWGTHGYAALEQYDDEDTEVSKENSTIIGFAIGIPVVLVVVVLVLFCVREETFSFF